MSAYRRKIGAASCGALMAVSVLAMPAGARAVPAGPAGGMPAKAAAQIAAMQKLKQSLSPTERKLDSRLAVAVRVRNGDPALRATPDLETGVVVSKAGTTSVDIDVTSVSPNLLARLRSAGASVQYASTPLHTIRAAVPESRLTTVASWSDVVRVGVATGSITAHETLPSAAPSKAEHAAQVQAALQSALVAPHDGQGAVVSEGDRTDAADRARARTKVQGLGVKVCALSDGVNSLAAAEASGELPHVDVLPGRAGSGDEGTAMLEIVHDLAPNADLGFATAYPSVAAFADNIRALRFDAGCDVIVDDILYFDEDPFQDGPIAQAVNDVTADGALYFSSAGNDGNTINGTSGNYEGDFVGSGASVGEYAGEAHDFNPGRGVQIFEPLSDASSSGLPVTLFWADPLGAAVDDYDLYLFDAANHLVALSQNVQDGTQNPYERLDTPFFVAGLRLAVVRFSGEPRYFQVSALRGRYSDSADGLDAYVTPGVTRGHSAAVDAFSVAAAPADEPLPFDLEPGDPPNPSGPYPNVFTKAQRAERFTSDGPRRVFFQPDGTPITPGNVTSTGGTVRQKPDITAADGVMTSVPGFDPFFGTSASAPHAAAIAALVLSGNPGDTEADIRAAFEATALDLRPTGVDGRTGFGVLRADRVLDNTGATPQPLVRAGTPTITPAGDGDAYLDPGESASVSVPVESVGDANSAHHVSVRLTSDDATVTVTPTTRNYGLVSAGSPVTRAFTVSLPADYPLGKPVPLTAKVSFVGVLSPQFAPLTIATGEPAATPTTFAYSGPPVPIPDANPTGASVAIDVSGIGYAAKLTFSVDGASCSGDLGATGVGIDHSYVGDLVGTLTSPDGPSAQLFVRNGAGGNNLCQVVFDDAAATPFSSVTSAQAPYTGTWRPATPLSSLVIAPVDGTWTFRAVDTSGLDTGSVRAVSLHVTGFVA